MVKIKGTTYTARRYGKPRPVFRDYELDDPSPDTILSLQLAYKHDQTVLRLIDMAVLRQAEAESDVETANDEATEHAARLEGISDELEAVQDQLTAAAESFFEDGDWTDERRKDLDRRLENILDIVSRLHKRVNE